MIEGLHLAREHAGHLDAIWEEGKLAKSCWLDHIDAKLPGIDAEHINPFTETVHERLRLGFVFSRI